MSDTDIAINVEKLSKHFILPHQRSNTIKSFFLNPFSRFSSEKQKAFEDINFQVKKGEFFGIVGRNGSGKSTLLKCIAGVYKPDSGKIDVSGTLVPFIELGVGFNPELSGRDNVYLNGSLLGFSRKQMTKMYKDIVEFAELKKFMDQKLKNYSSGMQVRLAFSIAIRARGDILLLDEVLAVGDSAFQQKCFDYFASAKNENKTIILVSHSMAMVERFCDRALFLEQGKIKHIGPSSEIARMYEDMFFDEELERRAKIQKERTAEFRDEYKDEVVNIKSVKTFQDGVARDKIKALKDFELKIDLVSREDVEKVKIGLNIKNRQGLVLIATDNEADPGYVDLKKGVAKTAVFKIPNYLTNDLYTVNLSVADITEAAKRELIKKGPVHTFTIQGIKKYSDSLTHPDIKIEIS